MKSSTDSRSAVVSYKRNVHGVLGRLTTKQTKLTSNQLLVNINQLFETLEEKK